MELGPPNGDRSWADVRLRLLTAGSATLSRIASLQLLDAHLRLRQAVLDLARDPASKRHQFLELVLDPARRRAVPSRPGLRPAQRPQAKGVPQKPFAGDQLTDEQLLGRPDLLALLAAVGTHGVGRGASGDDPSFWAPYLLGDGEEVRTPLQFLARLGLIGMPMSGRPYLYPRGERLLHRAE